MNFYNLLSIIYNLDLMDAKDEIKQRLSVEEVIGDYLELKRAGRNFKAISPFSNERTASFMVSPEKQIWHDFSSNKGGDIFSFIMEVEGVDFREALQILARKANLDLAQFQQAGDGSVAKLKKRLSQAMAHAVHYYHVCLSQYPEALAYVKEKRNFTPDTIRTWKLGYSPTDGSALYTALRKKGFTDNELLKAGLVTRRRDGIGDMFRGRIMVPLCDGQGNPVGFTARLLKENNDAPKYFNTPQTPLYDKGRQVFGLHLAKEAIRKQDFAVLVEGNFDVIASHQAGITNVVAAAGTAMTADHLRSLNRLSPNVRLAFDADQAGLNATERAIPIAQTVGINLTVIELPKGAKDPDELIQTNPEEWRSATAASLDAVSWTLRRYESQYDKSTAEGKRQLSTKALAVIRGLQDPVEKEHHLRELAKQLDVSVASLTTKLTQSKSSVNSAKKPSKAAIAEPDLTSFEDDFLAINAFFPEVRDSLKLIEKVELHTKNRESVKTQLGTLAAHARLDAEDASRLKLDEDYVKILLLTAEEQYASWNPADIMAEAMALARRIVSTSKKQYKNKLTAAIRQAEQNDDSVRAAQLLEQYQKLLEEE